MQHQGEGFQNFNRYTVIQQKNYGCSKELPDPNMATYCRVATGIYETTVTSQQYQNPRYNSSAPTFSSPPNSPLIGLVFDPSSPNYSRQATMDRNANSDRRSQSSWSVPNQEPIGTGAKRKIEKSQDKRSVNNADPRFHERYKDMSTETERIRKDKNLRSDSTSSLDFFAEGERMVSELCNIPESTNRAGIDSQKHSQKSIHQEDDKNKASISSELLLTALDKIVIHDQIPNQIVQLAVEACTDAENIAIAHHNRPCFKNIHSICAKTRSNVQKPDSAVANLHSQGIPWVIKNFIFSFVRILDGWKGVKELLNEKHETFSRIENKYYSPNIRECFIQWQAVTKEMLTHIYKTFKCLDHGFTMEQKSFTHNYYATNSTAPRHQNQNKFQAPKSHSSTPRHVNASPQSFNATQPPWMQTQNQISSQNYNEGPWPGRSGVTHKKIPVGPSPSTHNFYPISDQSELDSYQKSQFKCDPCGIREAKPRQSWTITNVPDFRTLEGMCHTDQRELYTQIKHKMDAELGKAPGQPIMSIPCDLMQRREMELKAKMIPLSHVEKSLIPTMVSTDFRGCYVQKNNSCGDTKEETDFFAAWGQMVQKEPNDFITHHSHNVPIPPNVVTISNNISGPVQFIDPENDEFHEMSKVYMKPGSYKVPIKPSDSTPFVPSTTQDILYDNSAADEVNILKMKVPIPPVTLAPQPKYNIDSWPCLMSKRADDIFPDEQKLIARPSIPCLDVRTSDPLDILNSMTSDRAWEAAKQSAPKLMDFIHEGSKSDTARLYDALGLGTSEEFADELKHMKLNFEQNNAWPTGLHTNQFMSKISSLWDQQPQTDDDYLITPTNDPTVFDETLKFTDYDSKQAESDDQIDDNYIKNEEPKDSKRCANFDQSGNYVKDENHKKSNNKSKPTPSGMWYHLKKKKPIPISTVKKFENVIAALSHMNEAAFVQHDMDIKMAPRFYEVVKYPMCLHDISTKLKNSSYTEYEQVVQDFRRIFNNVRLYLKSYPDSTMKKNVNKLSAEFEKILSDEFQNRWDPKNKSTDNIESQEIKKEVTDDELNSAEARSEEQSKIEAINIDKK